MSDTPRSDSAPTDAWETAPWDGAEHSAGAPVEPGIDEEHWIDGGHEAWDETSEEWAAHDPMVLARRPGSRLAAVMGILALVILAGGALFVGARMLGGALGTSRPTPTVVAGIPIEVEVPPGATARSIAALLEEEGVIADAGAFERAARQRGVANALKAGSYTLVSGSDLDAIIDVLVTGPPSVDTYRVTVIEGLRIEEMLDSLAEQTPFTVPELETALLDGTVTSPLVPDDLPDGIPPLARWEGLLFPDTYEFAESATAADVLQTLADTMVAKVESIDWSRLPELGVSRYEAIIVASLVEKEAKLDEDRPLIASVIYNRLQRGMPLQIDATVIYALGENPGRVLFEHLEIDSPYNTYKIVGLPPTPIGGVRLASLEAAADPADTDFLYYVLVDASGKHGFSETLDEHNRKVAQARRDGILP